MTTGTETELYSHSPQTQPNFLFLMSLQPDSVNLQTLISWPSRSHDLKNQSCAHQIAKLYASDCKAERIRLQSCTHQAAKLYASDCKAVRIRLQSCTHQAAKLYASGCKTVRIRLQSCTHQAAKLYVSSLPSLLFLDCANFLLWPQILNKTGFQID